MFEQISPEPARLEDPAGHSEGVTDDRINKPVLIDLMPEDLATSERIVDPAEEDQMMPNPTAELLCVHHALNHLPFSKIKMLTKEAP